MDLVVFIENKRLYAHLLEVRQAVVISYTNFGYVGCEDEDLGLSIFDFEDNKIK
mgnify:CR=1 FL=1